MLVNVSAHPDQFGVIGSGKVGDDVFYSHYEGASLEQLPDIYRTNGQLLRSLQTGEVYPTLLTDIYHVMQAEDASGAIQTQSLEGFTMVKFNGATSTKLESIEPARVSAIAEANGLTPTITWVKDREPAPLGLVTVDRGSLTYVGPESLSDVEGYDIELYQVMTPENNASLVATISAGNEPSEEQAQKMVE